MYGSLHRISCQPTCGMQHEREDDASVTRCSACFSSASELLMQLLLLHVQTLLCTASHPALRVPI